jgi:DNA-binding NtrC family response regulator
MNVHRILLIDDEEEFTAALAERLEMRGMTVDTASDGETALEKITARDYDAVLLDLAMPGWDGIETLKRIKKERADLQVVLLTGHATVGKGVEAMKLGAMDLVEKPVAFRELLQKIEEASAKKALLVEARLEHELDEILRKKGW